MNHNTIGRIGLLALFCSPLMTLAAEAPKPVAVEVAEVKAANEAPTIDLMATVHTRNPIRITAAVNGQLSWVAEPGSFIAKGEPVAKMDLKPLQLQLQEQQASIERARTELNFQQRELQRLQELKTKDATSAFQIDQTRAQRDLAKSDLSIAQIRSQQIQDQIHRAVITAPFDATVIARHHFAGEYLNRSAHIADMVDSHHLEARAFLPLKHLPQVKVGDRIALSTNNYQIESPITAIIPNADARSQTVELRISLNEQARQYWAAGQLVDLQLALKQNDNTMTVARDALLIRQDGIYVMRINDDNIAQRIKVDVGEGRQDWVAVKGELQIGDQVAVSWRRAFAGWAECGGQVIMLFLICRVFLLL